MSKQKEMFLVYHGHFWSEGFVSAVFDKKKDAVELIRKEGYKYNKEQDLFLNNKLEKWYKIDRIERNVI